MPTVEKAGPRRVAVQALPGVRLQGAETDASMGVGRLEAQAGTHLAVAKAANQGAAVGIDIYAQQQFQRRKEMAEARAAADQTAVMAAQNKMNKMRRDRVHGPEGTMNKIGKDALGEPEAVSEQFETTAAETMKGLATPEQRLMFEKWLVGERDSINLAVLDHTNRQMKAYEANELEHNVTNAVDLSIRENMLDLRQGALKLNEAEANIRRVGPRVGLTPEMIEAQVRSMRTQAVEGTVRGMIASGRTQDAKTYFLGDGTKENPGAQEQIDQQRKDDVLEALKQGTVRAAAQDEVERILTATGDYEKQRTMAKQIKDREVRDETLGRIEHEYNVRDTQQREVKRAFLLGISNKVDRERSLNGIKADGSWQKLDDGEKKAFTAYVEDLVRFKDMNVNRSAFLAEIKKANDNPLDWARTTDFTSRINEFQRADMNELINTQQSILNGERTRAQQSIDGVLTNVGVMNNVLSSAGIATNAKEGTPEKKLYDDMVGAIDKEVQRVQTNEKRKLNNDEIRAIADQFTIEAVITPGTGDWTDLLPGGKVYGDQRGRIGVAIAQIPPAERTRIEKALTDDNQKITYPAILDLWLTEQRAKSGQAAPAPVAPRRPGGPQRAHPSYPQGVPGQ